MGQKSLTYFYRLVFMVTDFLVINTVYFIAYLLFPLGKAGVFADPGFKLFVFFNLTWLLAAAAMRLYSSVTFNKIESIYRQSAKTIIIQFVLFAGVLWLLKGDINKKGFFIVAYGTLMVLVGISRFFFTYVSEFIIKSKLHKKIAIVGYNETGLELARYFRGNNNIYTFEGFFDSGADHLSVNEQGGIVGSIEECIDYAIENNVQEIYSTIMPGQREDVVRMVEFADRNCVRVKFVPAINTDIKPSDYNIEYLGDFPIISLRFEPLQEVKNRMKKRMADIIISSIVIIFILSWLIPLVGLIIKLESRGPVFFVQNRGGRDNRLFKIFKFRTMSVVESDGEYKQATKNDVRVTRVGKFLRKTSLDEMPQFLNVFLGNMSVVGPRPHPIKLNEMYLSSISSYMTRHYVKPGITGWAQVQGFRGETETPELMQKRIEHDIWYVESWSSMLDIRIIIMTIINVFRGEKNAY